MELEILLFAGLRDQFQDSVLTIRISTPCLSVGQLDDLAKEQFPALMSCSYRVAVNQEYVGMDTQLEGGEEIAFIPAVSGG